jgi:hypothetical protein
MTNEIWAGEVSEVQEPFGSGLASTSSEAVVTAVDIDDKSVTLDAKTAEQSHEQVAEEASSSYTNLLPYVKKLGNALSGQKSLTRVLYAFMAYPLQTNEPRLLNQAEKQMFQLLQDLAASKAFLMNFYAAEMMEQKQQELAAQEKGETNGEG